MKKTYSAVLFDFDYTLADSSKGIVTCFQIVLKRHNYHVTDDEIKRTIGKTLEDSFSILTGITDDEQLALLKTEYGKEASLYMTDNTYLFPETLNVLKTLKEKGLKIGIISTKYRFRILDFFGRYFPDDWFDIIIGGEDVKSHKPDPEGVNKAISSLKIKPENVLYIGDSVIDAQTAFNAGVDFIGVTSGMTTQKELAAFPHVKIINTLGELNSL